MLKTLHWWVKNRDYQRNCSRHQHSWKKNGKLRCTIADLLFGERVKKANTCISSKYSYRGHITQSLVTRFASEALPVTRYDTSANTVPNQLLLDVKVHTWTKEWNKNIFSWSINWSFPSCDCKMIGLSGTSISSKFGLSGKKPHTRFMWWFSHNYLLPVSTAAKTVLDQRRQ